MKKLMFGMVSALALCGLADIESSNIVGYCESKLKDGATMCAPMFVGTGTDKSIKITDLTPTGDEIDGDGAIYLQTLDAFGRTLVTYSWIDWGGDDVGWMNDDFEKVDVTFQPGQGLWTSAQNSQTGLRSCGEVSLSDCKVQLRDGATGTGNMTPIAINIQDLVLEGDEIDTEGAIYIQTLDAFGRTLETYSWIDWGGDDVGWMNDDFEKVDVTFQPGQGLWVSAQNEKTYLRFPAPEVK
jgi:hypothetical protein